MNKAKLIGVLHFNEYGKRYDMLTYEYRGCTYNVTDHGWQGEPLRWQHQMEQTHIDERIERRKKNKKSTFKGESAEVGFELFWEYVNS